MKTKARELKTRMTLMGVQVRDTVCRKGIVKTAKDGLARFAREEDGMGTVEIILIIVGICIADKSRILCGNFRCI